MAAEKRATALKRRAPTAPRYQAATDAIGRIQSIDGIGVIQADERTAAYLRPFDLAGVTLNFVPAAEETYVAARAPLTYEANRGTRLPLDETMPAVAYRLPFDFVMFGATIRDVHLSRFNGIHAAPPATPAFWQYDALELVAQRAPLISPMLTTPRVQGELTPEIYVRSTETFVTITWATPANYYPGYDARVTLWNDGRVRFSYVRVDSARPSAAVITSGAERWRGAVSLLGAAEDSTADLASYVSPIVAPMLDVTSGRVSRVAGLDLVRLEFYFVAAPDPVAAAPLGVLRYTVTFERGDDTYEISLEVKPDKTIELDAPRILYGFRSPAVSMAARLEGHRLALELTDDLLPYPPTRVTIKTSCSWIGDQASVPVQFDTPRAIVMADLSALPGSGTALPVALEVFTRPAVSLIDIWQLLQATYGWRDNEVDAVAVYENFETDIGFFARAYALVGNPGADGIGTSSATERSRYPNLIDMAEPYTDFIPPRDSTLLHEFGHRWLFYARYRDPVTGAVRNDLNPDSMHAAQWVDTRAPFGVAGPSDSSVMGGAVFTAKADGSFEVTDPSPESLSRMDLYLLGLAGESEVDPVVWLEHTDPPLRDHGFPYGVTTVRGTKHEVRIEHVIAANGPRRPSYPDTQRRFTIAFVLLVDPSKPAGTEYIAAVARARDTLMRDFQVATGGRGEVVALSVPIRTPRRRSARH